MKKEVADLWCVALRSGKYPQGKKQLKNAEGYCCLGVLQEISPFGLEEINYCSAGPTPQVCEWSGLKNANPIGNEMSLITMNDSMNMTFVEIADAIEKDWEML